MNIFLIRHGEKIDDDRNHELLQLTSKGVIQADLLGKRLMQYNIEKIYSSNMKRAIQTSEVINNYLGVEIIIKTELREINMGACDTNGWQYLEEHYPEFIVEYNKHEEDLRYPPDGECGEDVWIRVSKAVYEIIKEESNNIAIVTHGGVIRALICGLLQLNQAKRFYLGKPPENCSISLIKYDKQSQNFYIHSFNDYAHLEDKN